MKTCWLAAFLALAPFAAGAQGSIVLSGPRDHPYGSNLVMRAVIDAPCDATQSYLGLLVRLYEPGRRFFGSYAVPASACVNGKLDQVALDIDVTAQGQGTLGWHFVSAELTSYVGSTAVVMTSNVVAINLIPDFVFRTQGREIGVGMAASGGDHYSSCATRSARLYDRESAPVEMPPPNLWAPFGIVSISAGGCASAPYYPTWKRSQYITVNLQAPIPDDAEFWVYDAYHSAQGARSWRRVPRPAPCDFGLCPEPIVSVDGANASLAFYGDTTSTIEAALAIVMPAAISSDRPLQGLWWSGPEQSGWGLDIAKSGEKLFVSLFIYDAQGHPQWAVMPEGTWDRVQNVFHGSLYIPKGSPYLHYDAARFDQGTPVGTASLSFTDENQGHLDYVIDGLAGGKDISRFVFGARPAAPPYAGMWWGGAAQAGWGVSVQQQGDAIFATWYSYDADGRPTWFYMPTSRSTGSARYAGVVYQTTAAAWAGQYFDGSKTRASAVGNMELRFNDADHATMTTTVGGVTHAQPLVRFSY